MDGRRRTDSRVVQEEDGVVLGQILVREMGLVLGEIELDVDRGCVCLESFDGRFDAVMPVASSRRIRKNASGHG